MKIVTAGQMRELDRRTIEGGHVLGRDLMDRAGRGVFEVAKTMPIVRSRGVVLFAGKGNNGGDAIVAARYFIQAGGDWGPITLVMTDPPDRLSGDPLHHWKELAALKPHVVQFDPQERMAVASLLTSCGLVVDGLLGTGAKGEPRPPVREAIDLINATGRPVLAIDLPSGLDADSGRPAQVCVRADATVTMGLPKLGLLQPEALEYVGRLQVVDIGIPPEFATVLPKSAEYFGAEDARALLPRRKRDAHKGDFGHLLLLAGSEGYTGASVLAGQSAMRAGAGLVTLGVPRGIWPVVAAQCREVMPQPFDSWSSPELAPWVDRCDAVAVGPGLGASIRTGALVLWLLQTCTKPMVLDADALNVLATNPAQLAGRNNSGAPLVITPHPGEFSRLTGRSIREIQNDRWNLALNFARETGVVVLLKGARTVIASPDGRLSINATGNPGMASGGVGDVLTGIIGSLLARGLSGFDAARLGAWLHGAAADQAAEQIGEEALIASDIAEYLSLAFQQIR